MEMTPKAWGVLADLTLAVHFGFVLFVLFGLLLTWVGHFRKWLWVRNFWFRSAHLLCIGVVVAESIGGVVCPLTRWEADFRWRAGSGIIYHSSFMQYWIHRLMFFEFSEFTFTVFYIAFFAAVLGSWIIVPPRWPALRKSQSP